MPRTSRFVALLAVIFVLAGSGCGGGDGDADVAIGRDSADSTAPRASSGGVVTTDTTGSDATTDVTDTTQPVTTTEATGVDSSTPADQGDAAAIIAASADRAVDQSSLRMSMVMEMTGIPGAGLSTDAVAMSMDAAFDTVSGNTSMSMDMGSFGVPGLDVFEMLIVDQTLYMDVSTFGGAGALGLLGAEAEGIRWVKMDADALGQDLGAMGTGAADMTQTFDLLREVSSSVTELGTEDVRGVEATHYVLELDAAKVLEQSAAQMPDGVVPAYGFPELDGATLPVEVWVDADGLPRRMLMAFSGQELAGFGAGPVPEEASMTLDMEFYDYGAEIVVEAPPESETFDLTEMMGGFTDFGSGVDA